MREQDLPPEGPKEELNAARTSYHETDETGIDDIQPRDDTSSPNASLGLAVIIGQFLGRMRANEQSATDQRQP